MNPTQLPSEEDNLRERAATELTKNIVVTASAGTGKTTLLINRLLTLVLGKGIPVEKIVAITFTKKAGEELRSRLEERLNSFAVPENIPPFLKNIFLRNEVEWEKHRLAALDNIPRAQIGTIHSFAGHLLRLYPIQAGVDPSFREDEGSGLEPYFHGLWAQWTKKEMTASSKRAGLWREILSLVEWSDVRDFAQMLAFRPTLSEGPTAEVLSLRRRVAVWLKEWEGIVSENPRPQRAPKFPIRADAITAVFKDFLDGRAPNNKEVELLEEWGSVTLPKEWQGKEGLLETVKRMQGRALALSQVDEKLISQLLQALVPFLKDLKALLRMKGLMTFDEVLLRARDLVRGHTDVREALKKQIKTFLIDEFQDTDPLQGEILFYLAETPHGGAADWREVRLEPGKLFVVGDPKQSIYHFRGADMAAFEEFTRRMEEQGALPFVLKRNFRSQEDLLDAVNGFFPAIMREAPGFQPAYSMLESGRGVRTPPGLEAIYTVFEDGKKETSEDLRRKEAAYISSRIKDYVVMPAKAGIHVRNSNLKNESKTWIPAFAGMTALNRPLEYKDIALIFRASTHLTPYLEALREEGIPYVVEGEKTFYERQEMNEFLSLLLVLLNPLDEVALAGVLRSSLGGLTDGDILALKKEEAFDYRKELKGSDKAALVYTKLKALHEKAEVTPVSEFISLALSEMGVYERLALTRHGEQAIANIEKAARLADVWGEKEALTFRDYVRRLTEMKGEGREEGENPLADAHYDAVRVLTIHKAKGLEFPVVFLPNLSSGTRVGQIKNTSFRTDWQEDLFGIRVPGSGKTNSAMVLIEELEKERELAEEVRVLYVAFTRAKEKLIYFLRQEARGVANFKKLFTAGGLHPSEAKDLDVFGLKIPVTRLDTSGKVGKLKNSPKKKMSKKDGAPADWAKRFLERKESLEEISKKRLYVSPSLLMKEIEKKFVYDEEREAGPSRASRLGLLCHKIMEEWNFTAPAAAAMAACEDIIKSCGRLFELVPGDPASDSIMEEARGIMKSFFESKTYDRLKSAKILGREIPFFYSLEKNPGGAVMRGVIDVLFEEAGEIIVGDYKTNKTAGRPAADLIRHYTPQAEAYLSAISKTLGKKPGFELILLRDGKSVRIEL